MRNAARRSPRPRVAAEIADPDLAARAARELEAGARLARRRRTRRGRPDRTTAARVGLGELRRRADPECRDAVAGQRDRRVRRRPLPRRRRARARSACARLGPRRLRGSVAAWTVAVIEMVIGASSPMLQPCRRRGWWPAAAVATIFDSRATNALPPVSEKRRQRRTTVAADGERHGRRHGEGVDADVLAELGRRGVVGRRGRGRIAVDRAADLDARGALPRGHHGGGLGVRAGSSRRPG